MDDLIWLSKWLASQCDGEWESDYGITLESVNNPGWMLKIDLDGTGLDPSAFKPVAVQRSDTDWIEAKVEEGVFLGGCALASLPELLGLFRAYVEGRSVRPAGPGPGGPRQGPGRAGGQRQGPRAGGRAEGRAGGGHGGKRGPGKR